MSRRKSSVVLPFNATTTKIANHSLYTENVTLMQNKKTPARRRRTQFNIPDQEMDQEILEVCEGMTGKMWSIYRVSDLNNFSYNNQTTFARYGRLLSRHLIECFTEAVTLKATLMITSDVQGFEAEDPPVHIQVEDVQLAQPRVVYEGFLLSGQNSSEKIKGAVHLPVLLARGPKGVQEKVHGCLATLFSSAIHEVSIAGEDMLWMIAAWSGYINETKTNKVVEFLYTNPLRTETVMKCQYGVEFIKVLWNCIHDQKNRIVELKEVQRFHAALMKHAKKNIGLNLTAVPLAMYKTPDFELCASGKVKVKTAEFIPRILHFIADLCESRSRTDSPP